MQRSKLIIVALALIFVFCIYFHQIIEWSDIWISSPLQWSMQTFYTNSKLNYALIVVTAASSNHFETLLAFVIMYDKYQRNDTLLIIYDLGLKDYQYLFLKHKLKHLNLKYEWETFEYDRYPSYFNVTIAAGEYAWKPVLIHQVCQKYGGKVFWMDTGSYWTNTTHDDILTVLGADRLNISLLAQRSSGDIKRWTHPKMIQYLNYTGSQNLANRNGAIIAFDYD
eukprot:271505_1